jgi:hypothetical protein
MCCCLLIRATLFCVSQFNLAAEPDVLHCHAKIGAPHLVGYLDRRHAGLPLLQVGNGAAEQRHGNDDRCGAPAVDVDDSDWLHVAYTRRNEHAPNLSLSLAPSSLIVQPLLFSRLMVFASTFEVRSIR